MNSREAARPITLREAMVYAAEMGHRSGKPECYRWQAVWWRLHARESRNPGEPLRYARAQMALFRDMKARPEHYACSRRPDGATDWQWSGLVSHLPPLT